MTVQHEIKSQLAKLLATEDIVVEHKQVETAQFNVQTRVLTLPMWEKASNGVIDMLVGHEVGHALYTPNTEWWKEVQVPQQFVNVVEDARIEKLIKRRYEGLNKTFYNAYHELSDKDFFEIENKDLDELNLADRVNLHFKIGHFVDIDFDIEENLLVSKIELAETFDEVLVLAKQLYDLTKQQMEEDRKEREEVENDMGIDMGDETLNGTPTGESGESEEEVDLDYQKPQSQEPTIEEVENMMDKISGGSQANENTEPEVETMDALDEALKDLVNKGTRENHYIELPKVDIKKVVISNKEVHKAYDEHWTSLNLRIQSQFKQNPHYFTGLLNPERVPESYDPFAELDKDFYAFKKSAQKEVNYLVKEFECKKSAGAYARSSTSRTGILDTKSLHTYKFNEDLFKKITVVPDGKNHGLVFVLDWSGSMNSVMMDTLKQLYNLIWFCRKVQIPYEVYAFTIDYPNYDKERVVEVKDREITIPDNFHLLNFFTHKTKSKDLDRQMLNIFRCAACFDWNMSTPWIEAPVGYRLSGTPLNETMVALRQILPQFKKNNNVEKVQCVVLTDGEGQPMRYNKEVHRDWEDKPYMGTQYFTEGCFVRDRKLGTTYRIDGHYYDERGQTDVLLRNLKERLPSMNFIGIRIMSSREGASFAHRYLGYGNEAYEKVMVRWRKEKSFAIKNAGYHTYFGMASQSLGNDAEFEVQDDATKAQIKKAFFKSLKNKKMNKKILGEFIELVA